MASPLLPHDAPAFGHWLADGMPHENDDARGFHLYAMLLPLVRLGGLRSVTNAIGGAARTLSW